MSGGSLHRCRPSERTLPMCLRASDISHVVGELKELGNVLPVKHFGPLERGVARRSL